MSQTDKPCKCAFSFLQPHRKSKCALLDSKSDKKKATTASVVKGVLSNKNNASEDGSTTTTGRTSDTGGVDDTSTTCYDSSSNDQNRPGKGTLKDNDSDDDNSTVLGLVLNNSINNLGKLIEAEENEENAAELQTLIALWGNSKCDCPVASRLPHRKIKCRFKQVVNDVMKEIDLARSMVKECTDSSILPQDIPDDGNKQCKCFGSRFERHRKKNCFFTAIATAESTQITVEMTVVEKNTTQLTIEAPTDLYSMGSGFEQVYNSPGIDDVEDDTFSNISEDEFVEFVTVHNRTYTAEEVREQFERLQSEINRLKMAQVIKESDSQVILETQECSPVSSSSSV